MRCAVSLGHGQYASGESHLAVLPWPAPTQKRGMLFHGGRTQKASLYNPPSDVGLEIAEQGIPQFCADFGNGLTWANDLSQSRITSGWTYQKANFNAKTDKVLLYGVSMGGGVLLRWAKDNVSSVAGIVLEIPLLALAAFHDANRGGYATEMETAHGVSGTWTGNAMITARDPSQNTSAYTGIPILLCYSNNDPLCLPAEAEAFAAATGAQTINMGNVGHATSLTKTQRDAQRAFLVSRA